MTRTKINLFNIVSNSNLQVPNNLYRILSALDYSIEQRQFDYELEKTARLKTIFELVVKRLHNRSIVDIKDRAKANLRLLPKQIQESIKSKCEQMRQRFYAEPNGLTLRIWDDIASGKGLGDILCQEKISLDLLIKSLRKIEFELRSELKDKRVPLEGISKNKFLQIAAPRRAVLELLAAAYTHHQVAKKLAKKPESVSNDLTYVLQQLEITRKRFERLIRQVRFVNITDQDKLFFDRLAFLLSQDTRDKLMQLVNHDQKEFYLLVNSLVKKLTDRQRKILRHKLWQHSNIEIAKELKISAKNVDESYSGVLLSLRRFAENLLQDDKEDANPIPPAVLAPEPQFNPDQCMLEVFFPEHQLETIHPRTLKYLKTFVRSQIKVLKESGYKMDYLLAYLSGKRKYEIAKDFDVDDKVVGRSIDRLIPKIKAAYNSLGKYSCPEGINQAKWLSITEENRAIYLLFKQGKSCEEIIAELALNIKPNSIYPRVYRVERDLGVESGAPGVT